MLTIAIASVRRFLMAGLLSSLSLPLWAAEERDCTLQASHVDIDYGSQSRGQLLKNNLQAKEVSMGQRTMTINVHCRNPEVIGVRFIAPHLDADAYQFGADGRLTMTFKDARLDGKVVEVGAKTRRRQINEHSQASHQLRPDEVVAPLSAGIPQRGKHFSANVVFEPVINADATRVSDVTTLSANGQFEVCTQLC
ncbi:hypothetical protein SAMN04515618_102338 [Collimonas sp. OK307]|uniref:hypothetical protein n=1 Tax=Collimonas sp. OK307 TaxID=1801620 RepID=UPI0008E718E8|nr:hypothetical protein [Collimonas sp. OK307]SFH75044.1 hypothetical protein SAMN04515618_102338 [Collimonas sp. OK307]